MGKLARLVLGFSGVMILVMAGIVTAARAGADDPLYFLLYWCVCDGSDAGLYRANPDGSNPVRIADAGYYPGSVRWSPSSAALMYIETFSMLMPIHTLRWDGNANRVIARRPGTFIRSLWLPDSSAVMVEMGSDLQQEMSLYRVGTVDAVSTVVREVFGMGMQPSPDGERIAFHSNRDGYAHVFVMATDGGDERQITTEPVNDNVLGWSPDGERILFVRVLAETGIALYDIRPDGSDLRRLLVMPNGARPEQVAYSPDGAWITYADYANGQYDISILPANGGRVRRLTHFIEDEMQPTWSPDSQWIAFVKRQNDTALMSVQRMRPDGSGTERITPYAVNVQYPTFSPVYVMDWQPGMALVIGVGMLIGSRYKVQGKSAKQEIEQKTRRRRG